MEKVLEYITKDNIKNNENVMNTKIEKFTLTFLIACLWIMCITFKSYALTGDMFYFGGITEGTKLEKTVDKIVNTTKKKNDKNFTYKELIFLTGEKKQAICNLNIKTSGEVDEKQDNGSYTITYTFKSTEESEVELSRVVTLGVKYRKGYNQVIKDYTINSWKETITIGDEKFEVDSAKTSMNIPTIEYISPGITYYKTVISTEIVYKTDNSKITVRHTGQGYGYDTYWSAVETQNIQQKVKYEKVESAEAEGEENTDDEDDESSWEMVVNLTPNVTINRSLTYDVNQPYAIGFQGNYIEIVQNKGGLKYEIEVFKDDDDDYESKGTVTVPSFNSQEQLIAPVGIEIWSGSFAEEDIKKLFSLEILEGDPSYYVPNQALTRSQFIRMLVRALGYEPYDGKSEMVIFEDVDSTHTNYGYIVKAYEKGIIKGSGTGEFFPDRPINRQEAFTIYMRAIGLIRLANYNTSITPFIDDNDIDLWAKRDILALYNLGLIKGDAGYLKPKAYLSKAEGAALVNRMIDYLRVGITDDYVKNIINY